MVGYYEWLVSFEDGKKDLWFIYVVGLFWVVGLWEDISFFFDLDNLGIFIVIIGDSSGVLVDIYDCMFVWLDFG